MAFDHTILLAINGLAGKSPILDTVGVVLAQYGLVIYAVLMLLAWFTWPRSEVRGRRGLIYAVLGAVVALVISGLLSHLWFRPRPFIADPSQVHPLVSHANDSSFPSDHATGSFALATGTAWGNKRLGTVFYVLAILVAVARVFVGAHWPTDVIVGGVVGFVGSRLVLAARSRLETPVKWILRLFRYEEQQTGL